jgi:hypothetical protein
VGLVARPARRNLTGLGRVGEQPGVVGGWQRSGEVAVGRGSGRRGRGGVVRGSGHQGGREAEEDEVDGEDRGII